LENPETLSIAGKWNLCASKSCGKEVFSAGEKRGKCRRVVRRNTTAIKTWVHISKSKLPIGDESTLSAVGHCAKRNASARKS
jgi:hypothetical protein